MSDRPDLLLFDLAAGGHNAEYLGHLLEAWRRSERAGRALAVGPAALRDQQEALWSRALAPPATDLAPLPGPPPPADASALQMDRRLGALLREAVEAHRPRHVLLMRLDSALVSLALGLRFSYPLRLSGILFRPTLHHATAGSLPDRGRQLLKTSLLRAACHNRHFDTVFSLDATAVPALRRLGLDALALPDPVATPPPAAPPEAVRARFGIEPGRQLVVLFGVLDRRKNLLPLLDALALLPDAVARRTAVLLAGPLAEPLGSIVPARIAEETRAQVVLHDAFVSLEEGQTLLAAADLVWAAYDNHVGSSAVLIRAAAAGRPVLSQAAGLMGEETRRHRLGRTVERYDPPALAEALAAALAAPEEGFDAAAAAAFAQGHAPEAFARVILDRIAPA